MKIVPMQPFDVVEVSPFYKVSAGKPRLGCSGGECTGSELEEKTMP